MIRTIAFCAQTHTNFNATDTMATLVETTARSARTLLFWHPAAESLARSLLAEGRDFLERGDVTWGRFPDGWPNISFAPRAALEVRIRGLVTSLTGLLPLPLTYLPLR
jgi:hypothetical protein